LFFHRILKHKYKISINKYNRKTIEEAPKVFAQFQQFWHTIFLNNLLLSLHSHAFSDAAFTLISFVHV